MNKTPWEDRFAQRTERMKNSAIRELLKFTEQPDVISFAGGLPAPDVFPVEEFKAACAYVLDHFGSQALQYGATDGYLPLREMIAEYTNRLGISVCPENILITSGSQQALDLLGMVFINPGDRIVVESPTYLGALQSWNAYGAEYVSVACDEEGMCVDELEEALRTGPKFIYVLPNFQNPTGVTLSLERRKKLVQLADQYGVPIVEDDPYGQLRYEGENIASLEFIDANLREKNGHYTGNVIYLSSFSKILAPGLRLAWMVAPQAVISKLITAKQGVDLHTATFNQIVANEISKNNFLDKHIQRIQNTYRTRRDAMLESLEEQMPEGVTWTHPQGGLFLWATTPASINTLQLFAQAEAQKVAFVPGEYFYANGQIHNTMRLNFSCCQPDVINEGICRLGTLLKQEIKNAK
jgi:Transcriptional regulators containing a DNA-binding HTH domain and an aminotransferase domain (MocR family) and their eukaryotic orthologs